MAQAKRKQKGASQISRKRIKVRHDSFADLPWAGDNEDGISEVEDVEIVYEETDRGKIPRFNVLEREPSSSKIEPRVSEEQAEEVVEEAGEEVVEDLVEDTAEASPFNTESLLPDWKEYHLHGQLLRALHSKGFKSPTPIQAAGIPPAMNNKDVVGVAQTGSGKTLAYGLPILNYLLSNPQNTRTKRHVRALVLAPTRELALQVSTHLNACLNPVPLDAGTGMDKPKETGSKKPPAVSVAAIVGGMSSQKQHRILDRGVDVLVATPGRLWEIIEEDDTLANDLRHLKFLVLDEADRMIEAGHFAELENILRLTLRTSDENGIADDGAEDDEKSGAEAEVDELQTFVFSATLSKELQRNVKKRTRPQTYSKKRRRDDKPASTLDELILRLDFRDPDPEIIDLSPKGSVVSTLTESKIECLATDKDVYLYFFLLRYPGRSLVFFSSVDGIRRITPLMEILNIKVFPLHSQLEQRQRLKNLDRFKTTENSVLLATDIAARGLDIPSVDHVIHYQIPRSADVYVHRNGRTARAMKTGFSMLMCSPDERRSVRTLLSTLGRSEDEIPVMSVELRLLDKLKSRVQLAKQIENTQHKVKKDNHDKNWMREAAKALEVDWEDSKSDNENPAQHIRKHRNNKMADLKAQLQKMLAQPLVAQGVSLRYITSGSNSIIDSLLLNEVNPQILGVPRSEAVGDILAAKKKSKVIADKAAEGEDSEWGGISM